MSMIAHDLINESKLIRPQSVLLGTYQNIFFYSPLACELTGFTDLKQIDMSRKEQNVIYLQKKSFWNVYFNKNRFDEHPHMLVQNVKNLHLITIHERSKIDTSSNPSFGDVSKHVFSIDRFSMNDVRSDVERL